VSVSIAVLCLAAVVLVAVVSHLSRTIGDFLSLRAEARSLLTLHWRARASASPTAAVNHYRKIGGKLCRFEQSKRVTGFLMRLLGYRPQDAGIAMTSIANTWATNPAGSPDDEYQMIQCALYPQYSRFRKWRSFLLELDF
jgi:hypothetical protein